MIESDYLRIIDQGLPLVTGPRKRVIVIGAGMAGLTAASELLRAGHEASNRDGLVVARKVDLVELHPRSPHHDLERPGIGQRDVAVVSTRAEPHQRRRERSGSTDEELAHRHPEPRRRFTIEEEFDRIVRRRRRPYARDHTGAGEIRDDESVAFFPEEGMRPAEAVVVLSRRILAAHHPYADRGPLEGEFVESGKRPEPHAPRRFLRPELSKADQCGRENCSDSSHECGYICIQFHTPASG